MKTQDNDSEIPEPSVKCMFFAQYQFSHVCFDGISNSTLLLKPFSKITNEEAKELLKIMDLGHLCGSVTSLVLSVLDNYGKTTGKVSIWLEINDYLRSKGYAVPFMGHSVDDLISFGWVKLV
jgi:hypothetical protein